MAYEFMTDGVWERIRHALPAVNTFGHPRRSDRDVPEGILWILRIGARWRDMPETPPRTGDLLAAARPLGGRRCLGCRLEGVHRSAGQGRAAALAGVFHGRQLRPGQKRGLCVGKTKKGKGTKWMVVADGQGLPVGGALASGSPAEVKLVIPTLADMHAKTGRLPKRLIADKAYDADWPRRLMEGIGGELVCPHRRGRKRPPLQDGWKLKRYRKRWKVERLFAWLGNWRRLTVRHERLISVYSGFFKIACT